MCVCVDDGNNNSLYVSFEFPVITKKLTMLSVLCSKG